MEFKFTDDTSHLDFEIKSSVDLIVKNLYFVQNFKNHKIDEKKI